MIHLFNETGAAIKWVSPCFLLDKVTTFFVTTQ